MKYYLVEIVCFGDFEVRQIERIIETAESREALEKYCASSNIELHSKDGWNCYYITSDKSSIMDDEYWSHRK